MPVNYCFNRVFNRPEADICYLKLMMVDRHFAVVNELYDP